MAVPAGTGLCDRDLKEWPELSRFELLELIRDLRVDTSAFETTAALASLQELLRRTISKVHRLPSQMTNLDPAAELLDKPR